MKYSKNNFKALRKKKSLAIFAVLIFQACGSGSNSEETKQMEVVYNTIHIVTQSMEFQSVDTISSGWNTFEYDNQSNETHFILFDKLQNPVKLTPASRSKLTPSGRSKLTPGRRSKLTPLEEYFLGME